MNDRTKKLAAASRTFAVLSLISNILPVAFFAIQALANGQIKTENKLTLSFTVVAAAIMLIINMIRKKKLRSPMYLIILGIYIAIEDLLPLLVMVTICTMLDDFLFGPMHSKYHRLYEMNKEIDRRG